MRQRLFNKYFLAMAAIVLFSLTIMMMILSFVYSNYLSNMKYDSLAKVSDSVSSLLSKGDVDTDSKGTYYIMSNMAQISDVNIFITDDTATVIMCSCDAWGSDGTCEHSGIKLAGDIFERAKSANFRELTTLGIYKNPHYTVTSTYNSPQGDEGIVISTASVKVVSDLRETVSQIYLFSALFPTVLMFIALYIITYRMTRPLKMMSMAAKAMARGDFSRRIPVTSDDEIGELAVSFNQMTNSLARLEEMRKSFVANISHELKTPMTTIGGFIDGIIDGTIEQDKHKYYLGIASEEVKRLSRMVQSMLSISRLESGEFVLKPEKFDFRELLLSVVISQEQRIEKKSLAINGLDNIPDVTINADKDLIYRVIYNLVDNAIKFTNENGKIDFCLQVDSKRIVFRIQNTGRGIPQSELPYVFERFYKLDKSRSANKNSTGLGLYIVKTIVKTNGGSITVSSKENEFTAFEVCLPLTK